MTQKTKHTPGPWNVILAPTQVIAGEKIIVETLPNYHPGNFNEQLANARLIAAAPELLEIAEALVKWDFRNNREHFIEMAHAAIAKARGE